MDCNELNNYCSGEHQKAVPATGAGSAELSRGRWVHRNMAHPWEGRSRGDAQEQWKTLVSGPIGG